jgi:hypothetical protein
MIGLGGCGVVADVGNSLIGQQPAVHEDVQQQEPGRTVEDVWNPRAPDR